ncbi:MAG TPA: protease [Caldithrix abyssi]|uniref:Tricorn protease homolog n=1 Tax=Caldithrix abyssi TaxID=187145 RepID=A0A7V4U2T8_CALAY|nr:protease [Caldithrix abyssi]
MRWVLMFLFFVSAVYLQAAQDESGLLRFPAIYENQVVFTYAGDLYTVPVSGGVARRLTSDEGFEMFARFSPDGKTIAFTGQYDGNTEIYLIPAEGGAPKRLTFTATLGRDDVADRMGPNNITMTWLHDNKTIVFRSRMKSFNSFKGSLFKVNTEGDMPEQVPVPFGGFCSFSPDDSKMAYNRVFREFRTWKRYRGGMADDVWIFDLKTKKLDNITNHPAQDIIPMWAGNRIYFISDRKPEKRMNLYVYDLKTKETRQLTHYTDYDIKFPSLGKKAIVYEYGGFLYRFDLDIEKAQKIPVIIPGDFPDSRAHFKKVDKNIANYEIAPDGARALFGAHGDVFTVPREHGITRNLTQSPGVHERNARWSPDGKWIAFISDRSGEDEIYIIRQEGGSDPIQITNGAETYKYQIRWSPDSKKILWADRRQRLRYVDIRTKKITEVDHSPVWELHNYNWSPDSKWIAYSKADEKTLVWRVYLYSLIKKESYPVTDTWYDAGNAVFGPQGKYLFFSSSRDFSPTYSHVESNHAYLDMSRVYLLTLNKKIPSPFAPKNDEVQVNGKKDKEKKKKNDKEKTITVTVDLDNIFNRVVQLPVKPANYFSITPVKNAVFYMRRGSKDEKAKLLKYDLDKQKETELGAIGGYEISADRKKMLIKQNGKYAIIDLPSAQIKIDKSLDLSGLELLRDPHAEWNQIFNESWRQMREFFYAPNMHGQDWPAVREKYKALLPYVNHRNDLTYIIGEMVGELNVGHAYVAGGDRPQPPRIKTGLLGAVLKKDPASGYFRIEKILNGQNWDKNLVSPLQAIGVEAREGDYILAVDGQATKDLRNIYSALVNKAGKQVRLTLNSKPQTVGQREVTVIPIADESSLYYYNWVQGNIEKVNEATGGKVGYIHIPDMGNRGLNEFVKHYYPQLTKKALIIDVRGNGGGFVSPQIIERLRREIAMITIARNTIPQPEPSGLFYGPMVALADEYSASDGDIFTYRFKKYKLGKVVGKRTWGGVVGIRGPLPLIDGGQLYKPEFSRYNVEGDKWIMEGVGVEPDIFVDNDPAKEYAGIDEQLNKAIEVILEELKTKEKTVPPHPPYPDKR